MPDTLGNLGNVPGFDTLGDLTNYLGTSGVRAFTGPGRGSPAGLPVQAREAPNLMLTRERLQRELMDNPALARRFDANTTAEVGNDPAKRRWYQALTLDRAVQTGKPLAEVVNNPSYYPPQTTRSAAATGIGVDESLFAGANPANFATGNASYDPKTGRWVGFAGGPQTSTFGTGRGMELGGIEGPGGVAYAREMGYLGPTKTAIGPAGPQGNDGTPLAGWEATVGIPSGGVGYVNPERVARGATTNPQDLAPAAGPRTWEQILADFASGIGQFKPAAAPKPVPLAQFAPLRPFAPLGSGVETFRG